MPLTRFAADSAFIFAFMSRKSPGVGATVAPSASCCKAFASKRSAGCLRGADVNVADDDANADADDDANDADETATVETGNSWPSMSSKPEFFFKKKKN